MPVLPYLTLSLATLSQASLTRNFVLQPDTNAPLGSSKLVDRSFPSFGIQVSSFPAFTGNASSPNVFSRNLIRSIENRTGAPLIVRVGGTNGDYSNINPDQSSAIKPPMQGDGIGQKFVLGPEFYEGFRNWPNTQWVYDIPFAKSNHTDSILEAKNAISNIGYEYLSGLEIGNEVDLYVKQGSRPQGYGPANYSADFLEYSAFLNTSLGFPDRPLFQVLTLASGAVAPWSAEAVFEAGITERNNVKSVSLHHYEFTNTSTTLQETLMNHTFVKAGVNSSFQPDFQYMQQNYPDIEIVLGEVGRYTDTQSSVDPSEGIFGSALWTADYLLYTMSLNVTRVNMQLSKVFGYVAWHPVAYNGLLPEVRAPYYGHLFVSDFMGGSDAFRVKELSVDEDLVAAYAGYESDQLRRIAIFNYDVWNEGSDSRPSCNFTVQVPEGVRSVEVQTLTSPGGATSNSTFYWAGETWTYETNGLGEKVSGIEQSSSLEVSGGSVQVPVGASEAVIVHLY